MKSLAAGQVSLGFIGVGAMGSRIVQRLRDHNFKVAVYDSDHNREVALVEYGASVAASLAELAEGADVILSCLTNDDAVRNVFLGPRGILASTRPGQVVLEMSTISPAMSRELHAEGATRSMSWTLLSQAALRQWSRAP